MKRLLFSLIFALLLSAPLWGQSYLYYGYGCNGTSTNTCTVGTSYGNNDVEYLQAIEITTGSNSLGYSVKACGAYWNGTGTNFECAIYAFGATTSPISGCLVSAATASGSGWVENTNFSGCSLAASTSYYIVVQVNNATAGMAWSVPGNWYYALCYNPFSGTGCGTITWSETANTYNYYIRVTANSAAVVRHRAQVIQ